MHRIPGSGNRFFDALLRRKGFSDPPCQPHHEFTESKSGLFFYLKQIIRLRMAQRTNPLRKIEQGRKKSDAMV